MKQILARFRTSNHKLPIETGRWNDIERSNRLCNLCKRDIGDEFHYILCCTVLKNEREREKYIPKFYLFRPNIVKFKELFPPNNVSLLSKLCKFISIVNEKAKPPAGY